MKAAAQRGERQSALHDLEFTSDEPVDPHRASSAVGSDRTVPGAGHHRCAASVLEEEHGSTFRLLWVGRSSCELGTLTAGRISRETGQERFMTRTPYLTIGARWSRRVGLSVGG